MNRVTSIGGGSLPSDESHLSQADREQRTRFERAMRPAREPQAGLSQPEREQSALFERTMPQAQEPQHLAEEQRLMLKTDEKQQKCTPLPLPHEPLEDGSRQDAHLEGLLPHRLQTKEKRQKAGQEPSTNLDTRQQEGDTGQEIQASMTPFLPLLAAPLSQGQTDPSSATKAAGRQPGAEPHQEVQMAAPPKLQADAGLPETNAPAASHATELKEDLPAEPIPASPSQPIPPLVKTPGDLQLARVASPDLNGELGRLLERLAVDIHLELGRAQRPPLLRLTLPELGELAIRIARYPGELQVEILATSQGQSQLNQGRGDLLDRLQRLYPGEQVSLDLFTRGDSEQGSRQRRSLYEEWDADA